MRAEQERDRTKPTTKRKIQSEPNDDEGDESDEGDDARQSDTGITEATTAITTTTTTTTTTITTRMYYMLRNIYLQKEPTIIIIITDANTTNTKY